MAADFNKPVTTDAYTAVLQSLRDSINAVACMLNPNAAPVSGATNIPTGAIRLNAATGLLEQYSGTAWTTMATGYLPTAGGTMTGLLAHAFGAVSSQQVMRRMGWTGGVRRWEEVLEADASYSLYSYDSAGSNGVKALALSAVGAITLPGPLTAGNITSTGGSGFNRKSDGDQWLAYRQTAAGTMLSGLWSDGSGSAGTYGGASLISIKADGSWGARVGVSSGATSFVFCMSGRFEAFQGMVVQPGSTDVSTSGIAGQAAKFLNSGSSNYGRTVEFTTAGGTDGPFVAFIRNSSTAAYWQIGIAQQSDSSDFYIGVADNFFGGRQFRFSTGGNFTAASTVTAGSAVTVQNGNITVNNTSGAAHLFLNGNGATTPNKSIRANFGALEIVNSAYTSVIASISDAGALSVLASVTAPLITQSSDATLKYGIAPLKTNAERIKGLAHAAASFRWLADDRDDAGFIAQLVEDAEPLAVHRRHDGKLTINVVPIVAHLASHAADVERRLQQLERRAA